MSKRKVLSKFTILCWAAFLAILGSRWDTPAKKTTGKVVGEIRIKINLGATRFRPLVVVVVEGVGVG